MHLHKLTDLLSFHEVAVGGTLPQTEYYREKLKRLHPMQMLSSNILLPLYEISFSYMTVRGNYRQAKKYAFLAEYSEVDFEAELLLKDWSALTGMPGMAFGDEGNLEKAVKAVCASSPAHVPGTRALYSPWAGYAILGEIVRRIKGGKKSYSECVREDIFGPLGMDDTDYGYHGNPERRVDLYLRAEGMKAAFAALNDSYKGDAELPGANAHGTAMDCMRFAEMLRNKGTLNGARILAPLTVDYAYRNHTGDMPHDFWTNEQIDRGIPVFPANFTLAGGYAQGEGDYFNVCAAAASPNAFAAIGAGSTMLMVDFEKQLSVVLLTAGINNGMSHFLRVRRLNNVIYSTLR